MNMNRRNLLVFLTSAAFTPTLHAAGADWQARLVIGGFADQLYHAGLHIIMAPEWKTYWRVPGEAGIPPQIKVSGENVQSFEVLLPLPTRIDDAGGESIGYHDEVMFLLALRPKLADQPVSANVSAFFGMCRDICKPARFNDILELKPDDTTAESTLAAWQAKLPVAASFVTAARQRNSELLLSLKQPLDDIFIEGPDGLYFHKPTFASDRAVIRIAGLMPDQKLKGSRLRITAASESKGLEQVVTVT